MNGRLPRPPRPPQSPQRSSPVTQQPDGAPSSIAEQARLTSGHDFWTTESVRDVPSILMTDGPHGLRKQDGPTDHLGISGSVPATCFPPAVGLAQTWSPALARRVGATIADEARAQSVGVVLGPGVNLKRSVRGGRNLRVLLRGSSPHRGARRCVGSRSAGSWRGCVPEAFRGEQPGDRPDAHQRPTSTSARSTSCICVRSGRSSPDSSRGR
ncbi:putative beta-glucosidase [Gordonia polyisoprenivorans NBRC 16320 = JCM 10675]|nr:putative beta-glucosidase [Gordonia polyisoprenivorans NBRC 16320 = JCM 10675]